MLAENKAVVRRITEEIINGKNLTLADELYSVEYRAHPSLPGHPPGPDNAKRDFSMLHAAFPDLQASIESIVSEGDTVATQVTMSGTHRGKFFGFEPTGNRVTWPLAVFSRLVMANLQKIGL